MTLHHTENEYDGIQELDNSPPAWLWALFLGTIAFSLGYWAYYHTFHAGLLPMESYQHDVAQLALKKDQSSPTNEELLSMSKDAAVIARGRALFQSNCVSCHGENGAGDAGPSLADATWDHGSTGNEIFQVISDGVPENDMPSWKKLGNERIAEVTAFVLSLSRSSTTTQ